MLLQIQQNEIKYPIPLVVLKLSNRFPVDPVYTVKFSVLKVEIFRWEILGFEVFVRNY